MQKIQCEMCGGVDVVKDGEYYVCQNCGTKYTPESARKLLVQIDYKSGKDNDLKELRALRDKLDKEDSLETSKINTQTRIEKMQEQLGEVRAQILPTNQARNYRAELIESIEQKYKLKVIILNILFIIAAVVAVIMAGYLLVTQQDNPQNHYFIYAMILISALAVFVPYNSKQTGGSKIFTIIVLILLCLCFGASILLAPGGKLSPAKTVTARKGSTIKFGKYEQDNDLSNGKEDIEWIVLRNDENGILAISKYVLDYRKFAEEKGDFVPQSSTYEESIIRTWLADEFAANAFSNEELEQLQLIAPLNEVVSLPTKDDVRLADAVIGRAGAKPTEYTKIVFENINGYKWTSNTNDETYWLKDTDEDPTWGYKGYYYDRGIRESSMNFISARGVRPVILMKLNESEGD